ncbi:hypothetical protein O1M63_41695 [Streptomyces mirabilis]|nr:hypothetical protein [Streptomyces mirabilis]
MAVAQVGLCLLAAPAVRRLLDRERVWRAVRPAGGASMTLYLWHMLPVLIVAAAFYLTGLAPEPTLGSAAWWGLRLPWLLVLGVVLTGVVRALRPLERGLSLLYERTRPDPGFSRSSGSSGSWLPWLPWLGLAASVTALTRFATRGFAPDGRFPVLPALGLLLGTTLLTARRRTTGDLDTGEPKDALREAA